MSVASGNWLVREDGRDLRECVGRSADDAKEQAEGADSGDADYLICAPGLPVTRLAGPCD
jgi:hypothetical protein